MISSGKSKYPYKCISVLGGTFYTHMRLICIVCFENFLYLIIKRKHGEVWVTLRWGTLLCGLVMLWLRCFPARSRRSKRLTFSRTERLRAGPWLPSPKLLLPWLLGETTLLGLAHRWTSARAISRRVSGCSLSLSRSLWSQCWYCRAAESLRWQEEGWEAEVGAAWGWAGKSVVVPCPWASLEDATGSEWMLVWSIDLKGDEEKKIEKMREKWRHNHWHQLNFKHWMN